MGLFQSTASLYIPLFIVFTFVLMFIPSMMVTGAKADGVARAIGCYMLKTLGLILIALSAVQLGFGLVAMQMPDSPTLSALILVFVLGLGLMVHQSRVLKEQVDEASMAVSRLVFSHSCEVIGTIIVVVSGLSIALTFILSQQLVNWEMPATMILLGIVLMFSSSAHISHRNKHMRKAKRK